MASAPIVRSDRVLLGSQGVSFKLFRVPRRRHVHVLVNDDGQLEVRAPWRFSLDEARATLHEHGEWVLEALERSRTRVRLRPALVSGTRLPLLDDTLRLVVRVDAQLSLFDGDAPARTWRGRVHRQCQELQVQVHSLAQGAIRELLEGWYRAQARPVLEARMHPIARQLGVDWERVVIRAQRSRWGSCSSSGTLSLNWRLLLLPSRLCDYVLAHELCHLREMNHSPGFWALVAQIAPDYRDRRKALQSAARALPL